ncbi:MAG: hypothetical protein IT303_17365 [Dehalococcoidia bacterium]|nr:hypothetical protein [Dehalococcoidia bacterium]
MDNVQVRSRCTGCGRGLGFDEWSRGLDRCPYCLSVPNRGRAASAAPARAAAPDAYDELLDEVPGDLLDELVAMLEEEVGRRPSMAARATGREAPRTAPGPRPRQAHAPEPAPVTAPEIVVPIQPTAVREVLDDIGIGRSPRELAWAAWGFAAGFTLNVGIAKYAQVSTDAPMTEFLVPMLIGGAVAGVTSAAIGWGLAKVLDRD